MNLKQFIQEIFVANIEMQFQNRINHSQSERIEMIANILNAKYPNLSISDGSEKSNWVICKINGDKIPSIVHIGSIKGEAIEFIGTRQQCEKKLSTKFKK